MLRKLAANAEITLHIFLLFFSFQNTNLQAKNGQYKSLYLTAENATNEILHINNIM